MDLASQPHQGGSESSPAQPLSHSSIFLRPWSSLPLLSSSPSKHQSVGEEGELGFPSHLGLPP